jgi:hypothetical protein
MAMAAPDARAASSHHSAAELRIPAAHSTPARAPARAPTGPPLTSGGTGNTSPEGEASASAPPSGGDPLVGNGLGSPLCQNAAELSAASARNCQTSGFEAAQAPTGDYAFDVHINTGLIGANGDSLEQDYLISPLWMALVWVVHALIVALEWAYTIDLLGSSAMSGVTRGLREAQATFTQPWLVTALAVAGVMALYNGLVRRRVAETLGQALLMGAMMVGGLWVIMNPTGTVGALGQWANEASLGTLSAVTDGTPAHPDRTLANSMRGIFNGVVAAPWCYMEFGDVGWCEDSAQLDPRLRASGLAMAGLEQAEIGCGIQSGSIALGGLTLCAAPGSEQAKSLERSVELLHDARTNGELFLALPANQAARNSINDSGSLFNVLCGGSSEPCKGPTAAQAEFRTESGTQARLGGLFLIVIGALGMILLIGFIALHLLGAAIMSLLYLLLAPAAVIAPAFGDGGRAAFKSWASRLLGAVMAKLIYSLLLGIVLLMGQILMSLNALGWWTQWLLVTVLWWGAYRHRHQVLGFAHGTGAGSRGGGIGGLRLASRLMAARELGRAGGMVRRKLSPGPPNAEKRQRIADAARGKAKEMADDQARTSLEHDHREAEALVQDEPAIQQGIAKKRTRLARLEREHASARTKAQEAKEAGELAHSDFALFRSPPERDREAAKYRAEEKAGRQRAVKLQGRMDRLRAEIDGDQSSLTAARQTYDEGNRVKRASGNLHTSEQSEQRVRFFDAQAALPDRGRAGPGGEKRDYAGAASLLKYGRREFEALDEPRKRVARLEIDRELARHKERNAAAQDVVGGSGGSLKRREKRKTDKQFNRSLEQRVHDGGHELPSSAKPKPSAVDAYLQDSRAHKRARENESGPVRDARKVETHRRRQLGRERRR